MDVYPQAGLIGPSFAHELAQSGMYRQNHEAESNFDLDRGAGWAHIAERDKLSVVKAQ
jgi:hypothetical protein